MRKVKYGFTYMGSKATIINKIMQYIPSADNFYDLFGGGFSVSHYVLEELSHKFKYVHYNEINKLNVDLVKKAINGDFNYKVFKPEFIDRETFFKLKDVDGYVKYIWSFGNDGRSYLFGRNIEGQKKSLHQAIVFNEYDDFSTSVLGEKIPDDIIDIKQRRLFVRKAVVARIHKDTQRLQHLERLQQLQQLEEIKDSCFQKGLLMYNMSYENVPLLPNSVIYCDIPYKDTNKYGSPFDYEKFFNWAHEQILPVFISEYAIDDPRFHLVAEIEHTSSMSAKKVNKVVEKLYCNKAAYDLIKESGDLK